MKPVYCISGLGADQRIFVNLSVPGTKLVHVPWPAFDKHDDISCYAQKISAVIPGDNPVIIGLSFGGMLAVEIAKQRKLGQLFLISSAKTKNELPEIHGFFRWLIHSRILPGSLYAAPNRFVYERFGADAEDKKALLKSILQDTDGNFMKWAFNALLFWNNTAIPPGIIHMHGTADRIIPPAFIHPTYWITGGTHMMIYDRADEISKLITFNII